MARKKGTSRASTSVGGPGTSAGVDFQLSCAVVLALDVLGRHLAAPLEESPSLSVEPRADPGEKETRWDMGVAPDSVLVEAKLHPSRSDVTEWLERSRSALGGSARTCRLVCGRGETQILRDLRRLKSLREEAGDDETRLSYLARRDGLQDELARIGEPSAPLLAGVEVGYRGLADMEDEASIRVRYLVLNAEVRRAFLDRLKVELLRGGATRTTFTGAELSALAREAGAELAPPPGPLTDDESDLYYKAIFLTQRHPRGVSVKDLAVALGETEDVLRTLVAVRESRSTHLVEAGRLLSNPILPTLEHSNGRALHARLLRALLDRIDRERIAGMSGRDVDIVLSLSREVASEDPETASQVRDGFEIRYASFLNRTRRRFTIAHEMGHAFFESTGPRAPRRGKELEQLCDGLAAEFLMPTKLFLERTPVRPDVDDLPEIASMFDVSLSSAAVRCCELRGTVMFEVVGGRVVWGRGAFSQRRQLSASDELRSAVRKAMAGEAGRSVIGLASRNSRMEHFEIAWRPYGQERAMFSARRT